MGSIAIKRISHKLYSLTNKKKSRQQCMLVFLNKKKGIKSMKKSRVKLSRKQNVKTFKKGAKVKKLNIPKTSRGGIML